MTSIMITRLIKSKDNVMMNEYNKMEKKIKH